MLLGLHWGSLRKAPCKRCATPCMRACGSLADTAALAASFGAVFAFGVPLAGATAVTGVTATLSSHVAGATSTYTIGFTATSGLTSGSSTILDYGGDKLSEHRPLTYPATDVTSSSSSVASVVSEGFSKRRRHGPDHGCRRRLSQRYSDRSNELPHCQHL